MSLRAFALALFAILPLSAQEDALTAAPGNYKLVYENGYVRIIRSQAKPGERSPLHRHSSLPLLEVILSDGPFVLLLEDGRRIERRGSLGDISYNPVSSGPHQIENPGTSYNMAIRIELKTKPGIKQPPLPARDAAKVDPKHYTVELDNEHFRVLRATYAAGERSPTHQHSRHPFVMIFLGDQKWSWQSGTARPTQRVFSHGDFLHQSGGQVHSLQNIGGGRADFLVVELKGASAAPPPPAKRKPTPRAK